MKIKPTSISFITAVTFLLFILSIAESKANADQEHIIVSKADTPVTIDGVGDEASWKKATWLPLDKMILGDAVNSEDFSGKFKLLWDENYLYIQAKITDDVHYDQHTDPLHLYWDDDCIEIFLDEDASGGEHANNFNAFAYHVALDHNVVDIGPKNSDGSTNFVLLNDHIKSVWKKIPGEKNTIIWELAIKVYDDTYQLNKPGQTPKLLHKDKELGFMLAYCDNDNSEFRENFIGNENIEPINGDKNLGFKTADVFSKVTLSNN